MNEILNKLKISVQELEKEHGPLILFALFLVEGAFEKWDVVASATWLNSSEKKSYSIIVKKIQKALTGPDLLKISRVVIIDSDDPVVSFFLEVCPLTNGGIKESSKDFSIEPLVDKFNFTIKKAYILRCHQPSGEIHEHS